MLRKARHWQTRYVTRHRICVLDLRFLDVVHPVGPNPDLYSDGSASFSIASVNHGFTVASSFQVFVFGVIKQWSYLTLFLGTSISCFTTCQTLLAEKLCIYNPIFGIAGNLLTFS